MQLVAVYLLVAASTAYVLRAMWRTWFGAKGGCSSGCGKCAAPPAVPTEGRFPLPQIGNSG